MVKSLWIIRKKKLQLLENAQMISRGKKHPEKMKRKKKRSDKIKKKSISLKKLIKTANIK